MSLTSDSVAGHDSIRLEKLDNSTKNKLIPIAETKKPVMRVAASIPFGPILESILPAYVSDRNVTAMVAPIAGKLAQYVPVLPATSASSRPCR